MPIKKTVYFYIGLSLLLLLIITVTVLLSMKWYDLIALGQDWQRYFHQKLVQFLLQTKKQPLQTGLWLLLFSFLYGILHSAGPGHGKVIITTYLATQPKQLKKSLVLTLFSAIMQGIVAISLISGLLIILNLSTKHLKMSEYWLEFASYILIIMVGLFLCFRSLKKLLGMMRKPRPKSLHIRQIRPLDASEKLTQTHHASCECCGHKHIPNQTEMNHSKGWIGDLGIIFAIGMRPCSGALLVLIFSYTIGVYYWGMLATFAMSIGTAITTSLFALLVHFARRFAKYLVDKKWVTSVSLLPMTAQSIALVGGIIFIIMGIILSLGMNSSPYTIGNPLLMG